MTPPSTLISIHLFLAQDMSCRCSSKEIGQCKRSISENEKLYQLYLCYVKQPSNCNDLIYSKEQTGEKLSAEACKNGNHKICLTIH